MKTRKFIKIKAFAVLTLAVLSFSSCLKDDARYVDFASSPPLVEFPLQASNANKITVIGPAFPYVFAAATGDFNFTVAVNLASPSTLSNDVTFTAVVDNSIFIGAPVIGLATAKAPAAVTLTPTTMTTPITTYAPMPVADFAVTGLSGVIPAGQRLAYINLTVHGALVGNLIKNYAIRFIITSASQQISNYNTQIFLFSFQ